MKIKNIANQINVSFTKLWNIIKKIPFKRLFAKLWNSVKKNLTILWDNGQKIILSIICLAVVILIVYVVRNFAELSEYFKKESPHGEGELFKVVLTTIGGIGALFALYYTGKRVHVMEKGNVETRFNNAVGYFDNANPTVVLGGIHALHQIAVENKKYTQVVHSLFCSYLRENSAKTYEGIDNYCPVIIQTLIDYLFRPYNKRESIYKKYHSDLSYSTLKNCDFKDIEMFNVNFSECTLENCNFWGSIWNKCFFLRGTLSNCIFTGSSLTECGFWHVNMTECDFSGRTFLNKCGFDGSNLTKCKFKRATLIDCLFSVEATLTDCFFGNMTDCRFDDVTLTTCDFIGILTKCKFDHVTLSKCDFKRGTLLKCVIINTIIPQCEFNKDTWNDCKIYKQNCNKHNRQAELSAEYFIKTQGRGLEKNG